MQSVARRCNLTLFLKDYLPSVGRDGEMVALRAVLEAAGVPVTAAPGWLAESEHLRSLITTGREPARDRARAT